MNQDIIAETFVDMQGLITSIVLRHARRYGGDVEELIGEANILFVKAMRDYDPKRSAVTTWLTIKISKGLLDTMKIPAKRRIKNTTSIEEEQFCLPAKKIFSWMEFLDELSDDGKTIIHLVCEDGMYLQKQIKKHLNWKLPRIRRGFDEIRNALAI